ncbi:MAG: putative nucleotidyltransferase substrate binding domain-containing protein [Actinomycetota bacterium]
MSRVRRFLASVPPFDGLPAADLDRLASAVQVEFFPAGRVILHQHGAPAEFMYVVAAGVVEFVDQGQVVDALEEGEIFGHPSLLSGQGPTVSVRAAEETLCYLIPRPVAQKALGNPSGAAFLASSLRRRLDRVRWAREGTQGDVWLARADSLITRPPVVCDPLTTVADAAEWMARERISSVLIRTDQGYGIVTDRDLRTRVVAERLPYDRPVSEVMSFPVRTVDGDRLAHQVLLEMIEGGIHHLPVVDGGRVVGVLTDTDLLGLERRQPFLMRSEVEQAKDVAEVADVAGNLPQSVLTLTKAGLDPVDVGHVVAVTMDAITRRLIELAVEDLGDPPAPWAWVALGSEARREQALATDQDHALAYADEAQRHDEYFARLAAEVVSGLEACGVPRCRAGVLATERPWRRTVSGWVGAFEEWMTARGAEPAALTTIAFDYRVIEGPLEVERILDNTVRSAKDRPLFLRRLARSALDFKPPTGFRGRVVLLRHGEHAGTLDVKHRGLLPIIDLARLFALEAGSAAKGTLERLRAAREAQVVDEDSGGALEEAYRVILDARLAHQTARVGKGLDADNFLDPYELGAIGRARLKDAFRVIAHVQREVGRRFPMTRPVR